VRRASFGSWTAIGETAVASRATLESTRTLLAPARRGSLGASFTTAVVQTFRGHGVVNGAQADRRRVFATFNGSLETECLLESLHLTNDVLSDEGDDGAGGAGATGATRAVQVVGRLRRWVVVNDDGK
jgi:hypothetical protein